VLMLLMLPRSGRIGGDDLANDDLAMTLFIKPFLGDDVKKTKSSSRCWMTQLCSVVPFNRTSCTPSGRSRSS